jgi:ABC-type transporter Mla subunit MlaD
MTGGTDLTIRILREIQATLADHTKTLAEHTKTLATHTEDFAGIKETLRLHGVRLDTHSANFEDIGRTMQELKELIRRAPSNAELARDLRELEMRVSVLEGRRQ